LEEAQAFGVEALGGFERVRGELRTGLLRARSSVLDLR
jgi:hypothetical protein